MKTFETHWNGGRPFLVGIKNEVKNGITIEVSKNNGFMPDGETTKWKHWKTLKPMKVFVGFDPMNHLHGNAILLQMSANQFILVGESIITFSLKPGDSFHAFYSPIWGSDIAYPTLVGSNYTYLLASYDKKGKIACYNNDYVRERTQIELKKQGFAERKKDCSCATKLSKKDWKMAVELSILWTDLYSEDFSSRSKKNRKGDSVGKLHYVSKKTLVPNCLQ